ncbi:MAG: heavy metal translocating P-type ATPase [Phycisphaerae bacterium]|nr:heavy metal translocating P-type ATPase [Phycisphaerae bacterium]
MSCAHCGLSTPASAAIVSALSAEPGQRSGLETGEAPAFCCNGCKAAWEIIHGCGLERYYRVRDAGGKPARGTGRRYEEMDDPTFASLYCRPAPGGLLSTELFLEGVHCAACVWLVEKLPAVVPGVVESRLDLRRGLVRVTWDGGTTTLSDAARALDRMGYVPHPGREASAREARRREDRAGIVRLGVAGACAGNVMLLAFALYSGTFDAMEPGYREFFRWLSMGIGVLSLAWPGRVFFKGAIAALRTRTPHLDLPIAVGLLAGAVWGVLNTIRGTGEIYFDSLSVLVFVLLVGRWVQRRQQRWASDSMELLYSLTPSSARVVSREGSTWSEARETPVEALAAGDVVEVRAGDSVPVDGVVLEGESSVDQSLLTGESRPIGVRHGERVAAGSVNLAGRLVVRVEAAGRETRVGRLMELVEDATRRRAPIVRLTDRIAGHFVVVMLALAAATALAWAWINPAEAIDHATALLIVTCPCALGLATPLAVTVAIGRAARAGVLIKGGDALQQLAMPGTMLLDKTGTLTRGAMTMVRWEGDRGLMPMVAAIESRSAHPVARALVAGCGSAGGNADGVEATETTGGGMVGQVGGVEVAIGSCAFVRARAVVEPEWVRDSERSMVADGLTPVLVAGNGRVEAVAGVGDPVRDDAGAMIAALRRAGWRVGILSGDHPSIVRAVAGALGIEPGLTWGGATPEEKVRIVREQKSRGRVVMVGDGVNDAAALASADVGIAVHGGAEASLAAADVYLREPGLGAIVSLTHAARGTMRVIYRNLAASLFYNVGAAALAMAGVITPLIAAILMPASSLTVLGSSLRQRRFGGS